ncbi:efflux RND transporter periplasmic adaptor subunit [Oscillochloris sp. ZM17-4]|uniref:efflux RND transporter periplasmic adaptor subunit n=1 Tax=Oscillochloris sp. ZM17-4 TaxID=2866714 RepID=UPI001C7354B0|nr:efflux RND transporter periplasmic adaptor subunit [Oscillochloris sp. ZM17-4]MBX0329273.1 efflux RND transporter periplasmic adaptor subunit [Oscillochloris sp. ZM17-4]
MNRTLALIICLSALTLSACSQRSPGVSTTPSTTSVAATAPTDGPGALGEPTAEPTAPGAKTYTVQRGTIEDVMRFNGTISPMQYSVSSTQDGIVKQILVSPGQAVSEGDLIVKLDAEDLQRQLSDAKLATDQSQRQIDQAAKTAQLEVQQSQILLEAAQQDLAKSKEPPTALAVAQARTAVREAQANLDTVRNNASQTKNQAKSDMDKAVASLQDIQQQYGEAVAKLQKAKGQAAADLETQVKDLEAQMRDAEAAVASAVITYDTARNNERAAVSDAEAKLDLVTVELDELLKGADKFVIAEKERAVRSAELAVAQVRQRTAVDPALASAVEAGRLQMQQLEDEIAARAIVAPISGDVMTIVASAGETVQSGSPLIIIGDPSRLELSANGADMLTGGRTSLPLLTTGQAVEITFSRYPGKTFSGTITVPAAPTDTTDANDVYRFTFNDQGVTFAPGDQAEISVVLSRKEDVLYLPPEAVKSNQFRSSVMLRANGADTSVDVQIGLETPDKVEITSVA